MPIVELPPQVKLVCDDCGEALGSEEMGDYAVFDADKTADALRDFGWTRTAAGLVICETCQDERQLQAEAELSAGP